MTPRPGLRIYYVKPRSGWGSMSRKKHWSIPFTQQQIADITGQTSVNVNRVFADLERQQLIERKGREIVFTDWAELRRIAGFQPGYLQ